MLLNLMSARFESQDGLLRQKKELHPSAKLQDVATKHLTELEDLKLQLKLQNGDISSWMEQPKSHTPNTIQISTSNLPQLDWDNLAQHPSPMSQTSQSMLRSEPSGRSMDLLDSFPAPPMPRQPPAGHLLQNLVPRIAL